MGGGRAVPRFFIDRSLAGTPSVTLTGEDARHIGFSLRARVGDSYTLCDADRYEYLSVIERMTSDEVTFSVGEGSPSQAEPSVRVTLYQALVKGEKFDEIVQKSVELGVDRVVPVIMSRCVSRPDEKSAAKKTERYNKIARAAAMQAGRGCIPTVSAAMPFVDAVKEMRASDVSFLCYEDCRTSSLENVMTDGCQSVSFLVGPEGGIDPKEAALAEENGIACVTLGRRILRTETAPLAVLAAVMFRTGNFN